MGRCIVCTWGTTTARKEEEEEEARPLSSVSNFLKILRQFGVRRERDEVCKRSAKDSQIFVFR